LSFSTLALTSFARSVSIATSAAICFSRMFRFFSSTITSVASSLSLIRRSPSTAALRRS
jgi:hypothetical protein